MSKRNIQRAARRIQAECGLNYTTALLFVRENKDTIMKMITDDGGIYWKEFNAAACGLWRQTHH